MSYPTGSIPLSGAIGTTAESDAFPTHYDHLGYGGMRSVTDNVARDEIPSQRRTFGMLVFSVAENKLYKLSNVQMGGGSNSLTDNANWIEFSSGGSSGEVGPTGPQGNPGEDGKSAYELAVINGFSGTETDWLTSLVGPKGDQGEPGPSGSEGIQGPKGDRGETGPMGPQGIQGIKGDKGEQGDVGPAGPQGIQGLQGIQGERGFQGIQGDRGLQGDRGEKGDKGDTGAQGPSGAQGPQGEAFTIAKIYASVSALNADVSPSGISAGQFAVISTGNVNDEDNAKLFLWTGSGWTYITDMSGANGLTGPQGPQGPQGIQGPQGLQGLKGDNGSDGKSAYQVAVDNGYSGSSSAWLASLVGAKGDKGDTGSVGPSGPQGVKGDTGATGPQGPEGPAGADGLSKWDTTTYYALSGGSISVGAYGPMQKHLVIASPSNITMSPTQPFGNIPPLDGSFIRLIGASDPGLYVELTNSDSSYGCLLNGGPVRLFRNYIIDFVYEDALQRYIEVNRNF